MVYAIYAIVNESGFSLIEYKDVFAWYDENRHTVDDLKSWAGGCFYGFATHTRVMKDDKPITEWMPVW